MAPWTPAGHVPIRHIAVCNHSTKATDDDVVFWVEAVNRQLRDHVAPAWDGADTAPGVVFYGAAPRIPPDQAAVIGIVDDDGNADSAGYHAAVGGLVYGLVDMSQSDVPSRTLSHEALEMYVDPMLDRLVRGPDWLEYFVEICDATQEQGYNIPVELFGKERVVQVSDFVLPAWYALGDAGKLNHLGTLTRPFEIAPGGYAIAKDEHGRTLFLASSAGARMSAAKINRTSRTARIVRAG